MAQAKKESSAQAAGFQGRLSVSRILDLVFSAKPTRAAVVLGPPGIGKTEQVVKKAMEEAERLGKKAVVLNVEKAKRSSSEYVELLRDILENPEKYYVISIVSFGATMPDDLLGVPVRVELRGSGGKVLRNIEEAALKAPLAVLTVDGVSGTLLIDDALNANDNVRRSFLMAVLKERLVGGFDGYKLSDGVRVIATGNLVSESDLAVALPRVAVGRAAIFVAAPEPLDKWYEYMEENYRGGWLKDVYAFLKRHEGYYFRPQLIGEEVPVGPVPRAWTQLALFLHDLEARGELRKMLSSPEGRAELAAVAEAFVGPEVAPLFAAFMAKPVISVEEALEDPSKVKAMAGDMDMVFRFAIQLADKMVKAKSSKELEKYVLVAAALMEASTSDIAAFMANLVPPEERPRLVGYLAEISRAGDNRAKEAAGKLLRSFGFFSIAKL